MNGVDTGGGRLPAAGLRAAILAAADAIDAARDNLGRLDAVAGDGDHGLTMSYGARAVRQALDANPDAGAADLLGKMAAAMGSIGGAIGPIYAVALLRIAAIVRAADTDTNRAEAGVGPVALLRECTESAMAAIGGLGGAKPGDKTILDALAPVVQSLLTSEREGEDLPEALERARAAAGAGAEATASMVASIGRAARLGEQSRGTADAGATSFAIVVGAAVGSWLDGRTAPSER